MRRLGSFLQSLAALLLVVAFFGGIIWWQVRGGEDKPWIGSYHAKPLAAGQIGSAEVTDSDEFETLKACRSWGEEQRRDGRDDKVGYTCGTDCEYEEQTITGGQRVKTFVCAELHTYPDER